MHAANKGAPNFAVGAPSVPPANRSLGRGLML